MPSLKNKTIFITGASRGIGRSIALRCAQEGANIVIAAKSATPHPKLPGTIYTVAEEVEKAGGKALALMVDVRDEENVKKAVEESLAKFGGIDALINNAGAISLTNTENTPMKRYDLMQGINARAVFLCSQALIPALKKSSNAHIINLSPPLSIKAKWLKNNVAYTISKYGMSLCTIGMASEFEEDGIAVNALWPRTLIATAAVDMLMGDEGIKHSRTPEIMADAAYEILSTPSRELTGQTLIDEDFLRTKGYKDFKRYANDPSAEAYPDFFVD